MKAFKWIPLTVIIACTGAADEGMWLFTQPPKTMLRERHGFELTDAWLEHVQRAAVRFGGGSGSFVSEDGLLISNHHVGRGSIEKLSTAQRNLLRDGFHARTLAEELKCLDLEIGVLQSIEDVTARVNAAVPAGVDAAAAFAARRAIIAAIEKESLSQTGLRSDVVTLWQGAAYQLHRYKRYTDVRLVFAPEQQIAFFGGDPDNFEFPRCNLDICFFRAYENGQPAKTEHFLRFNTAGPREGELIFVAGHPGRTGRLLTVAELEALRDVTLPFNLLAGARSEVLLANWSERSVENARRARGALFGVQNGRKATEGRLAGLLDPELMSAKVRAEAEFKARLAGKPDSADALAAYARIAAATKTLSAQTRRNALIEGGRGFQCESFRIARTLLRAGDERPKPNGARLREFSDANRVSLELGLFSPKPIYTDLEILTLGDSLTFLAGELGATDSLVQAVLAGQSPRERAAALVLGTQVREGATRQRLYDGGADAVAAANDPMIELARCVDAEARTLREVSEVQGEIKVQAHAVIARARNTISGTTGYPDATSSLRLAFGVVTGYEEAGKAVPALTTFGSLFAKAAEMKNQPPYDLPASWTKRRTRLSVQTPFNFVCTADIIGGNSGSPVINRAGEFVGIIFDGNLQSLPWDYAFSEKQGRAVSVDSASIIASLDRVYGAKELTKELVTGRRAR
jgi:hypothetical protein